MHGLRGAFAVVGVIVFVALGAANRASSQALNRLPPARAPCTVLSGEPCHPSFCDVFHRGPCFPQYGAPVGENLQLTIVTTDDAKPAAQFAPDAGKSDAEKTDTEKTSASKTGNDADQAGEEKPLDSIGEMFAALRACWVPPPKDEARHGMEYTVRFAFKRDGEIVAPPRVTYASHDAPADVRGVYRDAVNAALARCTPLHFTDGMSGAVTGRPIAIRFVDERSTAKSLQ